MNQTILVRVAQAQARRQVLCAAGSIVANRDLGRDHKRASAILDDASPRIREWLHDLIESAEATARYEVAPVRYGGEPEEEPDVETAVAESIASALQDPRAPKPASTFRYGSR